MSEIVKKLRERHWRAGGESNDEANARRQREREEGADEIERLTAENERLRAALQEVRFNLLQDGYQHNSIMIEGIDAALEKESA